MRYIGLDIGTSGCKASVIDREGRVVRYSRKSYSATYPDAGRMEIDARVVYPAVKDVLTQVAGSDVKAIAIASIGEAVIPLGADDSVLAGSIYFSDIRGNEELIDVKSAMDPQDILRVTGMPVGPMFSAIKLLWIQKNDPALYAATKHTMLFGDYFSFVLTGEKAIDYSLASRTMLFDISNKRWSSEVADAIGLNIEGFSRPVQSGTVIGRIRPVMAEELGLPKETMVVAGGHDQAVSALGSGAVSPGESLDSIGSSECLTIVLEGCTENPFMTRYGFCCEPHVLPDTYVTLSFNASAGTAIRWYRDTFEPAHCEEDQAAEQRAYEALDAATPDAPTDILFLPYVAGSGTPWFDSKTGGAFIGLRQGMDRATIYKSVLEGISYEIKYNETLLERCGLSLNSIIASGGVSRSEKLMQIRADIMNRRIDVLQNHETATTGLALICARAMGDIDDIGEAAKKTVSIARSYEPDELRAQHYALKLKEYRSIYTSIKSLSSMPSSDSGVKRR